MVVDQSQLLLAQVVHLDARHHPRSFAPIKRLHFRGSIDQFFVVGVGDLPQDDKSMTGHHDPDPRLELFDDARHPTFLPQSSRLSSTSSSPRNALYQSRSLLLLARESSPLDLGLRLPLALSALDHNCSIAPSLLLQQISASTASKITPPGALYDESFTLPPVLIHQYLELLPGLRGTTSSETASVHSCGRVDGVEATRFHEDAIDATTSP